MAIGRKQVAPRQTIASQWGNWVWDQSVQSFASKADRDTQFPAPQRGACCTLDDHPGIVLTWDGAKWMAVQTAQGGFTTNAFGTLVMPFAYPFTAKPDVVVAAQSSSQFLFLALLDGNYTTATQVAMTIVTLSTNPPSWVANTAVAVHYVARGPI